MLSLKNPPNMLYFILCISYSNWIPFSIIYAIYASGMPLPAID